jgi:hypothetical protein
VFLADGSDDNLIRNAALNDGDRDSHIIIKGVGEAILDGNVANQTEYNRFNNPDSLLNQGIRTHYLDHFRLSGLTIRNTNAWGVKHEDGDDILVTNIIFDQGGSTANQDGLDLIGPCRRAVINNITGRTEDDMVAIGPDDPSEMYEGKGGVMAYCSITNVHRRDDDAGSHTVRISGPAETSYPTHSIFCGNTSKHNEGDSLVVRIGSGNNTDPNLLRYVTVDGVTAGCNGVLIDEACRSVHIENVIANGKHKILEVSSPDPVRELSVSNCTGSYLNEGAFQFGSGTYQNVSLWYCYG